MTVIPVNAINQISIEPHGPTLIITTPTEEFQLLFGNGTALVHTLENLQNLVTDYAGILAMEIRDYTKLIEAFTPPSTDDVCGGADCPPAYDMVGDQLIYRALT